MCATVNKSNWVTSLGEEWESPNFYSKPKWVPQVSTTLGDFVILWLLWGCTIGPTEASVLGSKTPTPEQDKRWGQEKFMEIGWWLMMMMMMMMMMVTVSDNTISLANHTDNTHYSCSVLCFRHSLTLLTSSSFTDNWQPCLHFSWFYVSFTLTAWSFSRDVIWHRQHFCDLFIPPSQHFQEKCI